MTLQELATLMSVEIEIRKYPGNPQWFASFRDTEVKDVGVLSSVYGLGTTPKAALLSYAQKLVGQLLVVDAYGTQRREFRIPQILEIE